MTCYNDYLFVEFLVDILVLDLKVDVNRIHITGLSNGAQAMLHEIMNSKGIFIESDFCSFPIILPPTQTTNSPHLE